jgi:hypothetical protein
MSIIGLKKGKRNEKEVEPATGINKRVQLISIEEFIYYNYNVETQRLIPPLLNVHGVGEQFQIVGHQMGSSTLLANCFSENFAAFDRDWMHMMMGDQLDERGMDQLVCALNKR